MNQLDHNYFEILRMKQQFTLDLNELTQQMTQLQASVHPDNHTNASEQEKRLMLQFSTLIHEAYGVLKDPIQRAAHLLELEGIVLSSDTTRTLSHDFLQSQMDSREALMDASGDLEALKELRRNTDFKLQTQLFQIGKWLDNPSPSNLISARELLLECQFNYKIQMEIKQALSTLNLSTIA